MTFGNEDWDRQGAVLQTSPYLGVGLAHRFVYWQGLGSLGLNVASIKLGDIYGDIVDVNAAVDAVRQGFGIIEEDEESKLGDIPLPRNEDVCVSLRVFFKAN